MKIIPLETKFIYKIDEGGNVYRDEKLLRGHINTDRTTGNPYRRYTLVMKDGYKKLFYGQRLMGITYLQVTRNDIVRHIKGTLDNSLINLRKGTHLDNQTIDRMYAGNYFNRGNKTIKNC